MELLETGSDSTEIYFTRKFLFEKLNESGERDWEGQIIFLKKFLEKQTNCPKSKIPDLHKKISYFIFDIKKKWASSYRMKKRFMNLNSVWLEKSICFPNYNLLTDKSGVGRPKVGFDSASERTKRMKTQNLRALASTSELCYAAHMSLRASGKNDSAKLVQEVTNTTPKRATRYKMAFNKWKTSKRVQLSPEEALSMFVEAQLTKHQYNIIRMKDKERFPSYKKIQQAKRSCYPKKHFISVTDSTVDIKLQGLLDHTTSRIMQVQHQVIESQKNVQKLCLITKTIANGHIINLRLFKEYTLETARLFVEKYPWYNMSPTVHKVLIHGPTIIEKAILPIGQLSEEAQEANNKMFKMARESFARKFSRQQTNEDIINRLLISSDPYISSMHKPMKQNSTLDANVIQFLESPDLNDSDVSCSSSNED